MKEVAALSEQRLLFDELVACIQRQHDAMNCICRLTRLMDKAWPPATGELPCLKCQMGTLLKRAKRKRNWGGKK